MKTKELLAALDLIDNKFKKCLINVNELRLFFPNESDKSFKVSLSRQVKAGVIEKIANGLYFNKRSKNIPLDLLKNIACALRDKREFYLSLESVLSEAGIISQIPNRLSFISSGKSKEYITPYGIIEFVKGDVSDMFSDSNISLDSSGIYVANEKRALKDAIKHRRFLDLIEEQRLKDELY